MAEPLELTFLLPAYPRRPGGGTRIVLEMSNRLAVRGHTVNVVCTRERRRPWEERGRLRQALARKARHAAGRIRDQYLWDRRLDWISLHPGVRLHFVPRLAAAHVPEAVVVIATAWWTMRYLDGYPHSKGRKYYLIQGHETWDGPEELVDATWRMSARKVVIASWLHRKARELGVDPAEVTHIPLALDQDTFRVTAPLADRPARVAMLYHPSPSKGCATGVDALERVRAQRPDLSAVLFGVSPRPSSLPRWIEYLQSVRPAQLAAVLNRCALYLCPSTIEGWHLPPAEAMACGCALVSTEIPGVGDYARHGQTARLVAVGDAAAMSVEILRLLSDCHARVTLARAGRAEIAAYTWTRTTELLEAWLAAP